MTLEDGGPLETRSSLLRRLQADDDADGWREFYRMYGGLIRSYAARAGLTHEESEEVVQETAIGVARRLPEFVYDPKVCRFKTWLLNLTRWRIQNQIRKRGRVSTSGGAGVWPLGAAGSSSADGTSAADLIHQIPEPALGSAGAEWDVEWEKNLLNRAMERVRGAIDERQFQIFDCYVTKGWPAKRVAEIVGVARAQVYLAKHRVAALLKKEVRRMEKEVDKAVPKSD